MVTGMIVMELSINHRVLIVHRLDENHVDRRSWVWIGTPGDGNWYDSHGDRNYFAVEVNGKRKILKKSKT